MGSQEIALRLREFWKGEGCPIIPPYGAIAAGGLTPDLFFGALGPEPWRSCQEVTTLDSSAVRYNGDPLRPIVDHHLQVALQEQSGELREVFTESLRMLGIQARDRDVRFVACSGEDACIAVRAPCWHVTVDGIEVGSVSHLQRVGGVDVDRVPVIADYSLGAWRLSGLLMRGKRLRQSGTGRHRPTFLRRPIQNGLVYSSLCTPMSARVRSRLGFSFLHTIMFLRVCPCWRCSMRAVI